MSRLVLSGSYTCSTQDLVEGMTNTINAIPGVFNVQVNGLVITFEVDRSE
jgi:hypothetical protein